MASSSKKTKYKTKYSDELKKQFPFLTSCAKSVDDYQYKFHCISCNLDLSCATGGANDVSKHAGTSSHKSNQKAYESKFFLGLLDWTTLLFEGYYLLLAE